MKSLLQKIKGWFEKIKIKSNSYKKIGISPLRDWKIILTTTFIVICFIVVGSYYFYTQINAGSLFMVSENIDGKEVQLNEFLLKKIVGEINARADYLTNLRQNKTTPIEPSS